jgi:putative transposase
MPWREVTPMRQKLDFISDYLRDEQAFSQLCAAYGISRKAGYKWVQRYIHGGVSGLEERARRPLTSPLQTPYRIRQAIIELRQRSKRVLGPKKLHRLLEERFPKEPIPSRTTIYQILRRAELITPRRRRQRVSPYDLPFAPVRQANELWSVDFKGQFKMGDGQWCYPLTVMDHQSRYLLDCQGFHRIAFRDTQRVFIRLFKTYGLPGRIRSDNGVPFASTAAGGLSRLSIWWIRLGILPERIEKGQPQQNGRHERMHRTLKQATARPASASLRAQQRRFAAFRREYNEDRPHEALNQQTPSSHYTASPRTYPRKLPELVYPRYFEVRSVRSSGVVYWGAGQIYVSHLLKGEYVGMEEIDDGIWDIYFGPVKLGGFNVRDVTQGVVPYWSIKTCNLCP